jgi:hypothetical protein
MITLGYPGSLPISYTLQSTRYSQPIVPHAIQEFALLFFVGLVGPPRTLGSNSFAILDLSFHDASLEGIPSFIFYPDHIRSA